MMVEQSPGDCGAHALNRTEPGIAFLPFWLRHRRDRVVETITCMYAAQLGAFTTLPSKLTNQARCSKYPRA
jgi:hypothetical protein